jgi:hypothetical protein
MLRIDKDKQYYLYIDISKTSFRGILFQLINALPKTKATKTIKD